MKTNNLDKQLDDKRRLIMGLERLDEEKQGDDYILLPIAAGVLPSIVASIQGITTKQIDKVVKGNKQRLQELCVMLTTSYQDVVLHMLYDDSVSRLKEIINDKATAAPSIVAAAKEILRMLKEGDAKKSLNNELMNSTYQDVHGNVTEMKKKIAEIALKKKKLGL